MQSSTVLFHPVSPDSLTEVSLPHEYLSFTSRQKASFDFSVFLNLLLLPMLFSFCLVSVFLSTLSEPPIFISSLHIRLCLFSWLPVKHLVCAAAR